jgi:hypothetical protein
LELPFIGEGAGLWDFLLELDLLKKLLAVEVVLLLGDGEEALVAFFSLLNSFILFLFDWYAE